MVTPQQFQIVVVARGIELYLKTGIKPSRMWTPGNMLATASKLTGKTYKRGQLAQAAADLNAIAEDWANA